MNKRITFSTYSTDVDLLVLNDKFLARNDMEPMKWLMPDNVVNEFLKSGTYKNKKLRYSKEGVEKIKQLLTFIKPYNEAGIRSISKLERVGFLRNAEYFSCDENYFVKYNKEIDCQKDFEFQYKSLSALSSEVLRKGKEIKVSIIDTGMDIGDFGGYIRVGNVFDPSDNNLINYSKKDLNGHGTFIASLIGMNPNERLGIYGLAPSSIIYPFNVAPKDDDYSGPSLVDEDIFRAICYSILMEVDIINNSWGKSELKHDVMSYISKALQVANECGIICVKSAGNSNSSTSNFFLSGSSFLITAGGSDGECGRYDLSNYDNIDIYAPALYIVGYDPKDLDQLNCDNGTSYAAAFVSGAIAALLSVDTDQKIRNIIELKKRLLKTGNPMKYCNSSVLKKEDRMLNYKYFLANKTPPNPNDDLPADCGCPDD